MNNNSTDDSHPGHVAQTLPFQQLTASAIIAESPLPFFTAATMLAGIYSA